MKNEQEEEEEEEEEQEYWRKKKTQKKEERLCCLDLTYLDDSRNPLWKLKKKDFMMQFPIKKK